MKQWSRYIVIGLIRFYQWTLGAFLGGHCRFYPSCSCYGMEAVQRHGVFRGLMLTSKRLAKCHPFHAGGIDLVPEARSRPTETMQTP